MVSKQELIDFENHLADLFDDGLIPYLMHLSGGNEDALIEIFKEVKEGDYIFTTHRSHYHYLLAGGTPADLEQKVLNGKSMFVFNRALNFFSSSIVAGNVAIAVGVAWALKRKGSKQHVWCFVGDGAEDEGHFYEAARYVDGWQLPCTFVVEDNNRSVSSAVSTRWGQQTRPCWWPCVRRYNYAATWPHGGNGRGKWLQFKIAANVPAEPHKRFLDTGGCPISTENKKYIEAARESMDMLAKQGFYFVGYNVLNNGAYGTLTTVPEEQLVETPVAENLMAGLAMGMTLEGFRSVLFFERHDFIFNAFDAIVNHMDKIEQLSDNQYKFPVIVRAVAGSVKPFYAGITHTSNLAPHINCLVKMPVVAPVNVDFLMASYKAAIQQAPVVICEDKTLY